MDDSILISDRANQKDIAAEDLVVRPDRATLRRMAGHKHAGSKALTRIDELKMDRSTRQQRHDRTGYLYGSAGSRHVIHLPLCDEDKILMVTADGEPEDEAVAAA